VTAGTDEGGKRKLDRRKKSDAKRQKDERTAEANGDVKRDGMFVVAGLAAGQAAQVAASQAHRVGAQVVAREEVGVGVLDAACGVPRGAAPVAAWG
jgi:hypothetical protein